MSETELPRDASLFERIAENPRPAMVWIAVLGGLVLLEIGAVISMVLVFVKGAVNAFPMGDPFLPTLTGWVNAARDIPTLLSRETIPNQGHMTSANGPWVETFPENLGAPFGLEPKFAWLVRFLLIYAYAGALMVWVIKGYWTYREEYRYADWTPRDDVINRFRSHSWGKFGLAVVMVFLVMAVFAPALGPTTNQQNNMEPWSYEDTYFNEETGQVETTRVGQMNSETGSRGPGSPNVGPWTYDKYNRWHPFGTMPSGKDLFTFMMYGARVSLFVGLLSIGISGFLATVFAMVTAYYKGLVDLGVVIVGDSIMSIPQLLLLIMVSAVFEGHWMEDIYNGGFLIGLIFAFTSWPALWRAVRGPAFQVSSEEWVDAAKSYGQSASATMRKHMLPYVTGYLLIYASMTLGGVILSTAALSFLGIGINAPTPEWGRAVSLGEPFLATRSWHIAFIPGVMVVFIVTAFNALGDGIRDSIDPQADTGDDEGASAAAAGGGG